MDADNQPIFGAGLRRSDDVAVEESGILGARRRWTNINRFEIVFLILAVIAALVSDGLTVYRLATVTSSTDPDIAYGVVIIVNSVFLLIFLGTGILQQRITDIVAFFISALMLTVYVVVHFALRKKESGDKEETEAKLRLVRLVFTVFFNILFLPLSIYVIRDYQRDEFSKRLFGAFPAARWPLKIYNIFDCVARIDTMFSISISILNLFNFNRFENVDKVLIGVTIVISLLWLGIGVGMIRLENRVLLGLFYLISLYQLGFLGYCLYSAIDAPATSSTTAKYAILPMGSSEMVHLMRTTTEFLPRFILLSSVEVPIRVVIYVCAGLNFFTHLLAMILGFICLRNFGSGLKERVFNSRLDKFFQNCFSRT